MTTLAVFVAKVISLVSKVLGFGAGATWPGEIALRLRPDILTKIAPKYIILVVGTNGKTTTTLMIKTILENAGKSVVTNESGANLENGIVSALIETPHADWGVFEVDESSLPIILASMEPNIIVLLNLFRDQLDRYGEVDVIAEKWQKALQKTKATIIANADDPLMTHLSLAHGALFFGINDKTKYQKTPEHATDSTFCLHCGARLTYEGVYFSHLGMWRCPSCGQRRPKPAITKADSPLPGVYNRYNALAAAAVAQTLNLNPDLSNFHPAFGRQEKIGSAKIFLSKNPTGFNQSLRTVLALGAKEMLLVLNDRIPDGRDVSWIWDVDFEMIPRRVAVRVAGDRVEDLALRLKYAGVTAAIFEDLHQAVKNAPYILPTYSAMLDVRKILTGKKIL